MLDRPDQSIIWRELKKKSPFFFFLSYFYGGKKKRSDIFRTWVELSNAVGAHVLNALEFFTCIYIYIKKTKLLLLSSFELYISNMCVLYMWLSCILNASSLFFSLTQTNSGVYFFAHPPLVKVKVSLSFTFDCGNLFFICPPSIIVVNTQLKNIYYSGHNEFKCTRRYGQMDTTVSAVYIRSYRRRHYMRPLNIINVKLSTRDVLMDGLAPSANLYIQYS